jgi:hypothetical protein
LADLLEKGGCFVADVGGEWFEGEFGDDGDDFDVVVDDDVEDAQESEIESGFLGCVEEFEDGEEAMRGYYLGFEIVVFLEEVVDLVAYGD